MTDRGHLFAITVLAIIGICDTTPSRATLLSPTPMMQRAQRADTVVVGRIRDPVARWRAGRIVTEATVEIESRAKGSATGHLEIEVPGGVVDGIGMHVAGTPSISGGERALLFLTPADGRTGRHRILDQGAGMLEIEQDPDRVRDEHGTEHGLSALLKELAR